MSRYEQLSMFTMNVDPITATCCMDGCPARASPVLTTDKKNSGTMMRKIDLIVIHCSATRADRSLTPDDLETQHRRRGFNGTGYHYYIRKDGTVHLTRPIERIGAHVKGFNLNSVGIC